MIKTNLNFSKIILLIFFVCCPNFLSAQTSKNSKIKASDIIFSADRLAYEGKIISLNGNVQIIFKGQYLFCDKAKLNRDKNQIIAEGNVILKDNLTQIEGEKISYNYDSQLGEIENGFVQSGQVQFEGKRIEKVGEKKYIVYDGTYTACTTCPASWSFSGQEVDAEIGGYAYIKYPILRIAGFPVFILPRLLVPLKSARQTGFLVPSLDFSGDGGTAVSWSWFWAISRSRDMTLEAKHYQKRGLKGLMSYRYVLNPESHGQLNSAIIKDQAFVGLTDEDVNLNRWFIDYKHHYELPDDYTQRVHLRPISDLKYSQDFPDEVEGHGDSAFESKASITKVTESQHMSAEITYNVSMLQQDPQANNESSVHRAPELRYNLMSQNVFGTGLLAGLDTQYVNFSRNGYSYDDVFLDDGVATDCQFRRFDPDKPDKPEIRSEKCAKIARDGKFDEDLDLIRTGHRFIVEPHLAYPINIGSIFSILPMAKYRETHYQFNLDDELSTNEFSNNALQRYLETDISLRTQFSNVFGQLKDEKGTRYKHEIEPQITYSVRPWVDRSDHGFFGDVEGKPYSLIDEPISDQDFFGDEKLQFDYSDRLFDKRIVNFAFSNSLIRKRWVGSTSEYLSIALFRVSQSYDFNERKTNIPQPWSPIHTLLRVKLDNFQTHTNASYNPYARITNVNSRVKILDDRGDFFQVNYTKTFIVDEFNQVDQSSKREDVGLSLGFVSKYFNIIGTINAKPDFASGKYEVKSFQYKTRIKPPGDCWSLEFRTKQVIGNKPTFKFALNFEFGGKT